MGYAGPSAEGKTLSNDALLDRGLAGTPCRHWARQGNSRNSRRAIDREPRIHHMKPPSRRACRFGNQHPFNSTLRVEGWCSAVYIRRAVHQSSKAPIRVACVKTAFANHDSPFATRPAAHGAALSNRLKDHRAGCIRLVGWAAHLLYARKR